MPHARRASPPRRSDWASGAGAVWHTRATMTALRYGSLPCSCTYERHEPRFVAVTGGPGAGKTAILEMSLRSFCDHVAVLPEAASLVFGGGFPRHDNVVARKAAQRAIFHVQREVEALIAGEGEGEPEHEYGYEDE